MSGAYAEPLRVDYNPPHGVTYAPYPNAAYTPGLESAQNYSDNTYSQYKYNDGFDSGEGYSLPALREDDTPAEYDSRDVELQTYGNTDGRDQVEMEAGAVASGAQRLRHPYEAHHSYARYEDLERRPDTSGTHFILADSQTA